jgi:hypothetical protein
MSTTTVKSPFTSVRRVVTGHNSHGKSIVLEDAIQPTTFFHPGSVNAVHDLYRTDESPALNNSEIVNGKWVDEIKKNPAQVSPYGSTFRSVDFAPGTASVRPPLFLLCRVLLTVSLAGPPHCHRRLRYRHERFDCRRIGQWRTLYLERR